MAIGDKDRLDLVGGFLACGVGEGVLGAEPFQAGGVLECICGDVVRLYNLGIELRIVCHCSNIVRVRSRCRPCQQ